MKFRVNAAATAILAVSLVAAYAQTSGTTPPMKKHATTTKKETMPPPPSVTEQINALRQEMQSQIDALKSSLADKDAQLRQAQQMATDAQAAAAKAESDAMAQQQVFTENTAAVTTLQASVRDLTSNQTSLATTVSDQVSGIKKAIDNPDTIHYKGITISPAGSFLAAETVWRSAAIGDDINTHWTSVPLNYADNYYTSEFYGSGRQSRLAVKATGKIPSMTLTGYYEMDWLGAGVTSNNNQSNSYLMRQRQLWADAKLTNGWDFSGGQGWSLATEQTVGLARGTDITPATIDAAYEPGFVWTRQYSFRVTKNIGKSFFMGISAENPEMLNPGGSNLPSNMVSGAAGDTSGLYNSGNNYSFNLAPDMIAKIAVEPGWGHWELFGISRLFRDRLYPNATGCGAGSGSTACTGSGAGAYNNTVAAGGVGGGFRGPLFQKKLTIGLKGLYGDGVGRYGDSTIADVTLRPNGMISPLHGFSALSTVEANPTNRLMLYFNYGGDYISRDYTGSGSSAVGYGIRGVAMSGCNTEVPPSGSDTTQGFDPSAPSNCKANTKSVQEFTAGYWYNIYAGPMGRLRQGLQYSWVRRDLWSGAGSTTAPTGGIANPTGSANGEDNMVFTSLRYYLP